MWYYCLSGYLLKEGYVNNSICAYVFFIKKIDNRLTIIVVYVDDLNLIELLKSSQKQLII